MIVGGVVWGNFSFSRSVCMSVYSAGISRVLIKYLGKYVKIYFNMKITFTLSLTNLYKLNMIKCSLGCTLF